MGPPHSQKFVFAFFSRPRGQKSYRLVGLAQPVEIRFHFHMNLNKSHSFLQSVQSALLVDQRQDQPVDQFPPEGTVTIVAIVSEVEHR